MLSYDRLSYQLHQLGWRGRALSVDGWRWETVKPNLAGRVIAREGDGTWARDFKLAQQQAGELTA